MRMAGLRAEAPERRERREGGSNSVVESQPSKLLVAGSIPVSRSNLRSPDTRVSFGWRASLCAKVVHRSPKGEGGLASQLSGGGWQASLHG